MQNLLKFWCKVLISSPNKKQLAQNEPTLKVRLKENFFVFNQLANNIISIS